MTQQTKMPDPVAYLSCNTQTGQPEWSEDCVCQDNVYSVMETGTIGRPVMFADQAEAYKNACVREAMGWQPIETAPKDGTAVLVANKNGAWIAKYEPVYQSGYRPENPWFSLMLNHDHVRKGKPYAPTHWMPLPPPPND